MSQVIKSGENAIVDRTLKQSDGSQLLFSALTGAAVQVRQGDTVIATKTLGTDTELRAGDASDVIRFEFTTALRALCCDGPDIELHWYTTVADSRFTVDSLTDKDWAHNAAIDVFSPS